MNVVVREFDRPDPELVAGFRGLTTGGVCDAMGRSNHMAAAIKAVAPGMKLLGPALTVRTYPADNLMIHKAATLAQPGDVVVVDAGGHLDTAVLGDMLAYSMKVHGVVGTVIDGAARDVDGLVALGFATFARALSPMGPVKASPGSVNVPIDCGGVTVHPGDIVFGDGDGVVVVPRASAAIVLEKARTQAAKEEKMRARIAKGEFIFDALNLGEALKALGVTETQRGS